MKILALDSSSSMASVAMVDYSDLENSTSLLYHYHQTHERTNSSALFEGLEKAVQIAGKPDFMVVGIGPGSYNGLRVSIAAAQGMASALGVRLRGMPSVLAIDQEAPHYWIAGDARGGKYWLASVTNHHFAQEPVLLSPENIPEFLLARPDLPLFAATSLPKIPDSPKITIAYPCAIALARLSQDPSYKEDSLTPLYLKEAHVTMPSVPIFQKNGN
ncbi:MAG: tRNA (adenosine(37)-N6)-threonylcarbamoyltransferase complex dimerization subunit type 1 TsaB [Chthoniobacterales bacterium]